MLKLERDANFVLKEGTSKSLQRLSSRKVISSLRHEKLVPGGEMAHLASKRTAALGVGILVTHPAEGPTELERVLAGS